MSRKAVLAVTIAPCRVGHHVAVGRVLRPVRSAWPGSAGTPRRRSVRSSRRSRTRTSMLVSCRNSDADTITSVASLDGALARCFRRVRFPSGHRLSMVWIARCCRRRTCRRSCGRSRWCAVVAEQADSAAGLASTTLRVPPSTISTASADTLKQDAVTRLDLSQAPVVALHRLLRLDQPVLQRGDGTQVAAERDVSIGPPNGSTTE